MTKKIKPEYEPLTLPDEMVEVVDEPVIGVVPVTIQPLGVTSPPAADNETQEELFNFILRNR